MCYTRKDHGDLEKETRTMTENRLIEEEARHRHEEHDRRRAKEEERPLIEKVKEVVGVR
jgi:protein subunit release factor B